MNECEALARVKELEAELAEVKGQRNRLLCESDDFECSIASALGWDCPKPFSVMVRELVAENVELAATIKRLRDEAAFEDAHI